MREKDVLLFILNVQLHSDSDPVSTVDKLSILIIRVLYMHDQIASAYLGGESRNQSTTGFNALDRSIKFHDYKPISLSNATPSDCHMAIARVLSGRERLTSSSNSDHGNALYCLQAKI